MDEKQYSIAETLVMLALISSDLLLLVWLLVCCNVDTKINKWKPGIFFARSCFLDHKRNLFFVFIWFLVRTLWEELLSIVIVYLKTSLKGKINKLIIRLKTQLIADIGIESLIAIKTINRLTALIITQTPVGIMQENLRAAQTASSKVNTKLNQHLFETVWTVWPSQCKTAGL